MRTIRFLSALVVLLAVASVFVGCGKEGPHHVELTIDGPEKPRQPDAPPGAAVSCPVPPATPFPLPAINAEPTAQEKYDGALLEALNQMAERKYPDALAALERARAAQDTEQIRRLTDKVRDLMIQQAAAQQTAQNIDTVLKAGDATEAARLAAAGLQQYGAGDNGIRLASLKQEADAVAAVSAEDVAARRGRLILEGQAALNEKNLRAACIAFEQALQYGDDRDLRRRVDELHVTLGRYDEQCRRAAELRRNPDTIEDAIAALQEAAKVWDTTQVRQDLEDYRLAVQTRRDRISVAEFEVRGEVGIPAAGRAVAEELLPAFRPRFEVVERGQLQRVVEELKLEASALADPNTHCEVGRLAKVRYLVLGSITPLCGITVNARLVDVRSGLVVQTSKIVASSPEEMMRLLPRLAQMLTMTDQQKIAFEAQLAQVAAPPVVPVVVAPVPPCPEPPAPNVPPPPPVVVYTPRPPDFGGIVIADFGRLPPPGAPPVVVVEQQPPPCRDRIVSLSLSLGDNLFRRGRYREAKRHYDLALSISPGEVDLRVRVDRCQSYLPPPPPPPPPPAVIVIAPPPPPVVVVVAPPRPRIAVLNFVVSCDPSHAPPGFGDWATDQLACQFAPNYEVVDRGEVCWYMGRLGLTMRDVVCDPAARCWLGRALGVRFFVFGIVEQTASFNVTTHLVDAETGVKQGGGSIHVQDHQELKLRMAELAGTTTADPAQRDRLQKEAQENERQLNEARRLIADKKPQQAITVCHAALKQKPNNVAMQTLLAQAEKQAQALTLEENERVAAEKRKAEVAAAQKRAAELAQQSAAARQKAEKEAAAAGDALRKKQQEQRDRAHDQLVAQARAAEQKQDYPQAIRYLESAVALKPADADKNELSRLHAAAGAEAKAKAEREKANLQAEEKKKHDAELAQAQARVVAERQKREADEQARRKAQEAHDQAAYAKFVATGQQHLKEGKFDAAVSALQSARQLHQTDEVDRLLAQAHEGQKKAVGEQKSAQVHTELERKQAEDTKAKEHALAEAEKKKQAEDQARTRQVQQLRDQARAALSAKQFDKAIQALNEAKKLVPENLDVQADLKHAEQARADDSAQKQREAEAKKKAEDQKVAELKKQQEAQKQREAEAAKKAEDQKRQAEAAKKAEEQKLAELKKQQEEKQRQAEAAKKADEQRLAELKKQQEEQKRRTDYARWMSQGQAAAAAKKHDEAVKAYEEALKLQPGDAAATRALTDARKALELSRTPTPPPPPRPTPPPPPPHPAPPPAPPQGYVLQMQNGAALEKQQKYADAVRAYQEALKAVPGDVKATTALRFTQHMADGQKLATARRFADAAREYQEALKVFPNHPDATAALKRAQEGKP